MSYMVCDSVWLIVSAVAAPALLTSSGFRFPACLPCWPRFKVSCLPALLAWLGMLAWLAWLAWRVTLAGILKIQELVKPARGLGLNSLRRQPEPTSCTVLGLDVNILGGGFRHACRFHWGEVCVDSGAQHAPH